MQHRKLMHIHNVAFCKNKTAGNCHYTSDMCWWKHEETEADQNFSIDCFICKETFGSKAEMMNHRRAEHFSKVRKCTNFMQNKCRFLNNSCWYLHEEEEMDIDDTNEKDDVNPGMKKSETESDSVFRKATENLKPPLPKEKKD